MNEAPLKQQCEAIRSGVGLFDASAFGQIRITGPDSAGFLHRMLSNEVQKTGVMEGRYHGLLDRKAMTLSLLYLLRLGEQEFLAVTPPQLAEKTLTLLTKMKFIEKVTLENVAPQHGLLQVIGPEAESSLKKIFPFESAKPNQAQRVSPDCLIWHEEIFQVPFFNLWGPRAALEESAQKLSVNSIILNDNSVRLLKMAAGFPEYGIDLDESHILLEAGLPYFYQRQKGCYPGQEVVERILAYGKGKTPKRLVSVSLPGSKMLLKGTEIVTKAGVKAGTVTSALYNPLEDTTQVMAYLESKFADEVLADVGECQFLPPTPQ